MSSNIPHPTEPSLLQSVDLRRLSWATPLTRDYCYAFEKVEPFYVGAPEATSTWNNAIAARRTPRNRHPQIAKIVSTQLRNRNAPPEALAAAAKLEQPETVAIVTGQQAGLFGGPLYTLLKALTTIALSRHVAATYQIPVVPIFWVEAEDHDLDEISTCSTLDKNFDLQRIHIELPSKSGQPAASVQLNHSIKQTLDTLASLLPKTEFTTNLLDQLSDVYSVRTGVVEAFSRWLDILLGSHGLVVFDSSDAAAKPLVGHLFDRELRLRGKTSRLADAAGKALSDLGYHAQVSPPPDAVALFQIDGSRETIRLRNDIFTVGDSKLSANELLDRIQNHPDMFSPNVLLRPIVQDALFPTVSYVAGPNELAYLGQLRDVYAQFGIPMPLIYPRATATIIDRTTVKFLSRYNVSFESLQAQGDETLNQLLIDQLPPSVEQAVGNMEQTIAQQLNSIEECVPIIDSTLSGAVRTTQHRMERDLQNLRRKIVQATKRRDDTIHRQFRRARAQAFPSEEPQERSVAFVYFLNRYGPALIDRLLTELPLSIGQHWLFTL